MAAARVSLARSGMIGFWFHGGQRLVVDSDWFREMPKPEGKAVGEVT